MVRAEPEYLSPDGERIAPPHASVAQCLCRRPADGIRNGAHVDDGLVAVLAAGGDQQIDARRIDRGTGTVEIVEALQGQP